MRPITLGTAWFSVAMILAALVGCGTPPTSSFADGAKCFLADTEEQVYSEISQRNQRVSMTFELIDGVKPSDRAVVGGRKGCWIPAGLRRVQFRVFLQQAGWIDGGSREARAAVDVELMAGRQYKVSGDFTNGIRKFRLVDANSGEAITEFFDIGYFAPIRGPVPFTPLLIPIIKS